MTYDRSEAQRLFAQAVEAVIAQGRPSAYTKETGTTICLYRSDDGAKCAAGHVIPDAAYLKEMEGEAITTIAKNFTGLVHLLPHADWLLELQEAHDSAAEAVARTGGSAFVREFRWRAAKVAGKHLFDMPA